MADRIHIVRLTRAEIQEALTGLSHRQVDWARQPDKMPPAINSSIEKLKAAIAPRLRRSANQ